MNKGIKKTNRILMALDNRFIECFTNANEESFNNDWVDISLCCIDETQNKLFFSSAKRKMLHISSSGKSTILTGSNYPIGGWQIEKNRSFKSSSIDFRKGDTIYLGSDGMQDQIGGPIMKKYKSVNLHRFLENIHDLPFNLQKEKIESEFDNWKSNNSQQDDVCLLGIRL